MIDVAVPVRGALPYVQRCLAAICGHTPKPFRLILHDDASDPETARWLEVFSRAYAAYDGPITLLRSDAQVWFTTSVNRCLAKCSADWIAILNSDVEIQDPDWVSKFQAVYEQDPKAGLLGAADSYGDAPPTVAEGKVQGSFWFLRGDRLRTVGKLGEREPAEVHIRSDDAWSAAFRLHGFTNYYLTNVRHVHGGESHPGGGASWNRDIGKLPKWIDVVHARNKPVRVLVEK
jgi:glycosyltransferase involved in cell wall biosynthesis